MIARLSEGKPQDLQRKGRTRTASHGTLAGLINSRHGLLYCDVAAYLGVSSMCRQECRAVAISVFWVDVEAVIVCALRVNWSSLLSLCLCQARALRLGCEARERARASNIRLDFRHAPSNVAAALRFDSIEDTQDVTLSPNTLFKMPLGRFVCLVSLLDLLKS